MSKQFISTMDLPKVTVARTHINSFLKATQLNLGLL